MKLYVVAITAVFLCMISTVLRNTVFYSVKLEEAVQLEFQSYSAKKFIAQSFKNACKGKGFKSLEQWQSVCAALFKLESINYEPVSDSKNLMYASWNGSSELKKCSGEVYAKIKGEAAYEN